MKEETKIFSESLFERRIDTVLLSIVTAAVLGMFGFLWSMNAKIAVLEERDQQRVQVMDKIQTDVNSLRNEVSNLNIKVVTLQEKVYESIKK